VTEEAAAGEEVDEAAAGGDETPVDSTTVQLDAPKDPSDVIEPNFLAAVDTDGSGTASWQLNP